MNGKFIAGSKLTSTHQHTAPCSDCPWRRDSIPGWLGGDTSKEFVRLGHSDDVYNCHVITNQQCAGLAVFRANVIKRCDPPNLRLPPTRTQCSAGTTSSWPTMRKAHSMNAELVHRLGEANAHLLEMQIQARRERKRQKRVSPATREALHLAEVAQRAALQACEATWSPRPSPVDASWL